MVDIVDLETLPDRGDILLLVTPTVWTAVPMVGVHLVQAAARQAGLTCGVLYTNLLYAGLMEPGLHDAMALEDHIFIGERLFTAAAFDLPPLGHRFEEYFRRDRLPDHLWPANRQVPEELEPGIYSPYLERLQTVDWRNLEKRTREWICSLARHIVGLGYRIIGATTTHGGLAPAIALLREIKTIAPHIVTILGGTSCRDSMAEGILSLKTGIDYIYSGEGEITFPALAKRLLAGQFPGHKIIAGEPVMNLDTLPLPDYREYFRQSRQGPETSAPGQKSYIPYELSRGCSYGRCTFCGQKGSEEAYRRKSPDRGAEEIRKLVRQTGIYNIYLTDNTIGPEYTPELFTRLAVEEPRLQFLFQARAAIPLESLVALKEAGVSFIQPGIETLSPSLLRRMDKGVTPEQIITLLRYGRSLNLDMKWNLLYGIPGEQVGEYREMLELMPLLRHLQPPQRMIPLQLVRHSRYWENPAAFGIKHFRPAEVNREFLPATADLEKLAVFFAGDYEAASFANPQLLIRLYGEFTAWRESWTSYAFLPLETMAPALRLERKSNGEILLRDTRGLPGNPTETNLSIEEAKQVMNPAVLDGTSKPLWVQRAVAAKLGIVIENRYIPLATAEPSLLREFIVSPSPH